LLSILSIAGEAPAPLNQEKAMARTHHTLALLTLLASAPLVTAVATAAQSPTSTSTATDRAAPTAPVDTMRVQRSNADPAAPTSPQTDLGTPTTPVPMNLPDEATSSEVKGEYGIGVAGLVLGTLVFAAIVVGALYFIARRSWSHSH
jgi:hypothetical protein